jgi:hypothetical protein
LPGSFLFCVSFLFLNVEASVEMTASSFLTPVVCIFCFCCVPFSLKIFQFYYMYKTFEFICPLLILALYLINFWSYFYYFLLFSLVFFFFYYFRWMFSSLNFLPFFLLSNFLLTLYSSLLNNLPASHRFKIYFHFYLN